MPVFAGGPAPASDSPPAATSTRAVSAPGTVFAFLGLLLLLFVVAFAIGRQAGPVAPDLRRPGPPEAPVKMGDEGGGHGRMSLGEPGGHPVRAERPRRTTAPAAAAVAPVTTRFDVSPAPTLPSPGGVL